MSPKWTSTCTSWIRSKTIPEVTFSGAAAVLSVLTVELELEAALTFPAALAFDTSLLLVDDVEAIKSVACLRSQVEI